jgi:hypothetical protein
MFDWCSRPSRTGAWLRAVGLAVVATVAIATVDATPASADEPLPCVGDLTGSLSVSKPSIELTDSTTVSWSVDWTRSECQPISVQIRYRDATSRALMDTDLSSQAADSSGSASDHPQSSGSYFVEVLINTGELVVLGSAPVNVTLPVVNGRTTVTITQPNQNGLFAQAIGTTNALVRVAGDLDLDLSHMSYLEVKPGVEILGDRTAVRAGPRVFTTTFPRVLLAIGTESSDPPPRHPVPSDHVRISGIRLDGGESDDPFSAVGEPDADGIGVYGSQHVEIDHSEIYRWRGSAVNVHDGNNANDPDHVGRINRDNADTVWVHDNYIHHNQHPTGNVCVVDGGGHAAGYGVEASDGAYVKIDRNVFDWNRHSIAGDGKTGTGYLAYDNLILPHGGVHFRCLDASETDLWLFVLSPFAVAVHLVAKALDGDSIYHTHAIDMHAVNSCSHGVFVWDIETAVGDHNCGPAGEYMDIEFNTVLYTAGNGIHLRGTPTVGMDVKHNVFAHQNHDGGFLTPGAILQNETGLRDVDNIELNTFTDRLSCDFDGDGTSDPFIATGVNWWYASSALDSRWVFLNRSPARVADITLRDVDGDGRCDESAEGQVFLNPDPQPFAQSPGNISTLVDAPVTVNLSASGGTKPYSWDVSGLPPGLSANPAGQISGVIPAANAAPTYTVTATVTAANAQRSSVTFTWSVLAKVPNLLGLALRDGTVQNALTAAGLHLGNEDLVYDCTDDTGTVLGQRPPAGQSVAKGSAVSISVASRTDRNGHHCSLN